MFAAKQNNSFRADSSFASSQNLVITDLYFLK